MTFLTRTIAICAAATFVFVEPLMAAPTVTPFHQDTPANLSGRLQLAQSQPGGLGKIAQDAAKEKAERDARAKALAARAAEAAARVRAKAELDAKAKAFAAKVAAEAARVKAQAEQNARAKALAAKVAAEAARVRAKAEQEAKAKAAQEAAKKPRRITAEDDKRAEAARKALEDKKKAASQAKPKQPATTEGSGGVLDPFSSVRGVKPVERTR